MARSHLKVYFSFDEDTACLTDAERGRLLLAMVRYAKDGTEPSLTGNERFLWPVVRGQIDRDIEAYDSHIESGKRGGRPKNNLVISENQTKPNETKQNQTKPNETKQNQTKPNETKIEEKDKDKEEDKDKDNDKGVSGAGARFAPPTPEDVAAFCRERGNSVDPVKFCAFYQSKGWKVGKNPMRDWRAAVITWERDDGGGAASGPGTRRTVAAQQYSQRDYSGEDEDAMERMIRGMG
ncbi:MAG: hypothetical protein IIZ93_13725 [Acidaminococcaceae bacterium]|nr:hypothetical protein [Acidaminococcaceae bacterium]